MLKKTNDQKVTTYLFNEATIRVVQIGDDPWFVGTDVVDALGIGPSEYRRLAGGEKTKLLRTQLGMKPGRDVVLVSENGLYKLVMRSDKPEAKKFQDWVTREVLPSIRKDGAYVLGEEKVRTGATASATAGLQKIRIELQT